jgi:hypothetical protein
MVSSLVFSYPDAYGCYIALSRHSLSHLRLANEEVAASDTFIAVHDIPPKASDVRLPIEEVIAPQCRGRRVVPPVSVLDAALWV